MNNSRNSVIRQLLASTTALAFISSSVHAENWSSSVQSSEDDTYMEFSVGNITIGGPLRRLTTEERRQILISIRNIFGDLDSKVPEVPVAPPPPVEPPSPTSNPAWWRTPEFNLNPGLATIGVEHRYAQGATGQGTLAAIMDSGIDMTHEDVDINRMRRDLNYDYEYFHSNRVDNGRPDNIYRRVKDLNGHGTSVYGIIGASRNDIGVHGVAPDAEFMILRNGFGYNEFHDALRRVTDAGVDAMNNSWAFPGNSIASTYSPEKILAQFEKYSPGFAEQLGKTIKAGVSIVFATGNEFNHDSQNLARLPVAFPGLEKIWIAVTALNDVRDLGFPDIDKANFANACGSAMNWCLAAPGTDLVILQKGGGTRVGGGTSYATPHVTGAILVLKSQFPELTTQEIHQILFDTAVDLGAPGVDAIFGRGALNLGEAVTPQGQMRVELGSSVGQSAAPLSNSWFLEGPVTGGILATALSDRQMLVTDAYDRGYFANIGPRVINNTFSASPEQQVGLSVAFSRNRNVHPDLANTGFDLRFDPFGSNHDVTRIAHIDPIMALVAQSVGSSFSVEIPTEKATFSMAHATTAEGDAVSFGAGVPFGDGHSVAVSLGQAHENDSLLGSGGYGAFAGLNSTTVYGRVQAGFEINDRVTLDGSLTAGRSSFRSTGILTSGETDARAMALGLTVNDALTHGDKLSVALARPFAVSGGEVTLSQGTGISAALNGVRTNQISRAETTVPLGKANRAPELHLGYLHGFDTKWSDAALAFGGVARLDGGAKVMAARAELVFKF